MYRSLSALLFAFIPQSPSCMPRSLSSSSFACCGISCSLSSLNFVLLLLSDCNSSSFASFHRARLLSHLFFFFFFFFFFLLCFLLLLCAKTYGNEQKRTNRIVFKHTQRSVLTRSHERLVVAGQGHGDEADGDGAGFCCVVAFALANSSLQLCAKRRKRTWKRHTFLGHCCGLSIVMDATFCYVALRLRH